MPPQIVRLVLLTIGIVGSYLVARFFLTPASFGQYGWYRANALVEIATPKAVYVGAKACDECHAEEIQKVAKAEHKNVACESCHGAGQAHSDNPDRNKISVPTDSLCVRCHETDPSRPEWLKQINSKDHYTDQKCTECHVPHQPNEVP